MPGEELWIITDPCPCCRALVAETVQVPEGLQVTWECLGCGWRVMWALDSEGEER